jgi:hypothetical protein
VFTFSSFASQRNNEAARRGIPLFYLILNSVWWGKKAAFFVRPFAGNIKLHLQAYCGLSIAVHRYYEPLHLKSPARSGNLNTFETQR